MAQRDIGKRSRRYFLLGVVFLVLWGIGLRFSWNEGVITILGVFGFVLHFIFGKAYTLIPTYFERDLAYPPVLSIQLPFTVFGVVFLSMSMADPDFPLWGYLGASLWFIGVSIFVGHILFTIRDNLSGADTGTSESKMELSRIDRVSNAFIPIALLYLFIGSVGMLGVKDVIPFPSVFGFPGVIHLTAAGTAALMVFAIGFRLLPRFMATRPPGYSVYLVLPPAAIAPLILSLEIPGGDYLWIGGLLETGAVVIYSIAVLWMFRETDRDRVGFYGVVGGGLMGVVALMIALHFSLGVPVGLLYLHPRVNVLGFLGLTIFGVMYQFYPPKVGGFPGARDSYAFISMALVFIGLFIELAGGVLGQGYIGVFGWAIYLAGILVFSYQVFGLLVLHPRRK